MSQSTSGSNSGLERSTAQPMAEWATFALSAGLQAQEIQLALWGNCQTQLLAFQAELLDLWVCRFAGGVPLDA